MVAGALNKTGGFIECQIARSTTTIIKIANELKGVYYHLYVHLFRGVVLIGWAFTCIVFVVLNDVILLKGLPLNFTFYKLINIFYITLQCSNCIFFQISSDILLMFTN